MTIPNPDTTPRPIAEINTHVRNTLERELRIKYVTVVGTVGRISTPASGHIYFDISDNDYSIPCFLRQVNAKTLGFKVRQGMKLEVSGVIRVYDKALTVQIEVESAALVQDAPTRNLDELEAHLKSIGQWRTAKHPLPFQINRIGLVTSNSSRALDDFENFYADQGGQADIWHERVPIEGEQAAPKIAEAIQALNRRTEIDVIVLTRGGGRSEELAVFSDPLIAQAIAQSKKPIVTGIGHESDETLADRAADVRAITPTAAAVLLAHHQSEVISTPNSTALPRWLWVAVFVGILTIIALLLVIFVQA